MKTIFSWSQTAPTVCLSQQDVVRWGCTEERKSLGLGNLWDLSEIGFFCSSNHLWGWVCEGHECVHVIVCICMCALRDRASYFYRAKRTSSSFLSLLSLSLCLFSFCSSNSLSLSLLSVHLFPPSLPSSLFLSFPPSLDRITLHPTLDFDVSASACSVLLHCSASTSTKRKKLLTLWWSKRCLTPWIIDSSSSNLTSLDNTPLTPHSNWPVSKTQAHSKRALTYTCILGTGNGQP